MLLKTIRKRKYKQYASSYHEVSFHFWVEIFVQFRFKFRILLDD